MQADKFPELIERAGGDLAKQLGALREKAELAIANRVEEMKQSGEAVELGEDELRMLAAYRRFKSRSAAGEVFSWTVPRELGIALPQPGGLLVDPREVAAILKEPTP